MLKLQNISLLLQNPEFLKGLLFLFIYLNFQEILVECCEYNKTEQCSLSCYKHQKEKGRAVNYIIANSRDK